ncbi:cytochrome P450 [Rickenella mellea]|uniref:Cytochrome P450 n=1 Tax=Rickenella mellea TaxID=50990 RepID=A0A4Y7PHI5_9AGAM|nr:cytochrome P450 [Rickenella mellea]
MVETTSPISNWLKLRSIGGFSIDILLVISALLLTIAWRSFTTRLHGGKPLPPGPASFPVIGNLLAMPATGKEMGVFASWAKKWGPIVHIKTFGRHVVVLNTLKAANELLERRSELYSDRPARSVPADSISTLPFNQQLKDCRRLLHHALNPRSTKVYRPGNEEQVRLMLRRLLETPEAFVAHIRRSAGATIMKVAYDYDVTSDDDRFIALAEAYSTAFSTVTAPSAFWVDFIPFLEYLPDWVPGASLKRMVRSFPYLQIRIRAEPYEYTTERMAQKTNGVSFVSAVADNHGGLEKMSETELEALRWAASAFYGGGTGTTVSIISWFILAMCLFPEVQKKAQAEIDSVVGNAKLPGFVDRPELPYIEAMCKETLRWNCVLPGALPHAVNAHDEYDGYHIPPSAVIPNMRAMTRDEQEYKEPHIFRPERFLGPVDHQEKDARSYAFGFGRRICPGLNIANDAIYINIVSLLATFNFSNAAMPNGVPITPLTVQGTGGLIHYPVKYKCSITPRSERAKEMIYEATEELSRYL